MHGFTLIELMIVVVMLAVVAAIAIPSYTEFVLRANRSEARAALSDLASREEQFFLDNKTYTGSLSNLNVTATTENQYYSISIPVTTSIGYTLWATASGRQAKDTDCATMQMTSLGAKTPVDCW